VIHANEPIDAIQRFIGRVELGLIPHLVDTVIFISGGEIKDVYTLELVVRVPTGMTESDLARPVVEVRDFFTGELKYEIYTYGEENVVVPVEKREESPINKLAKKKIYEEVKRFDKNAEIDIVGDRAIIKVDNRVIPIIIGKKGKTIQKLEEKLGIGIEIVPKTETTKREVKFETGESGKYVVLRFDKRYEGKNVSLFVDDEFVSSGIIGKNGVLRIKKTSEFGKKILSAVISKKLRAFI